MQIAEKLGIKVGTVKTHLSNLYRKLRVVNQRQLLVKILLAAGIFLQEEQS